VNQIPSIIEEIKSQKSEPEESKIQSHEMPQAEEVKEESDDDFDPHAREQLPYLKSPENKPSIFKVIKDAIGKDLTKMAVPVHFNEPISMLQKTAEIMEY
jgi:oxysterol-binding protein 1|tara:strand:+ start:52 stop:351 length:300 start_codon:yes stop_codon:yes gene_type:complete